MFKRKHTHLLTLEHNYIQSPILMHFYFKQNKSFIHNLIPYGVDFYNPNTQVYAIHVHMFKIRFSSFSFTITLYPSLLSLPYLVIL